MNTPRVKCVSSLPSSSAFKECNNGWSNLFRITSQRSSNDTQLAPYRFTLILSLTHTNNLKLCVIVCISSPRTYMLFLSVFKSFRWRWLHKILKGLSHPMSGHSCSSTPASRPFPDPSALAAPPPVTSSSSCYPER